MRNRTESFAAYGINERMIRVTRETHDAPAAIQQRIATAGGTNRFGEANFRVVWGGSRLTWIGGRWTDRDEHGVVLRECVELRQVPKYPALNRWHIERWMPPESYGSPALWYAQTAETENGIRLPALGPYPARGDYEHCFTLENDRGGFIPLTAGACIWIVRAIEWARRQAPRDSRAALLSRQMQRDRDWERAAGDIFDDSGRAFHGQPFTSVSGAGLR